MPINDPDFRSAARAAQADVSDSADLGEDRLEQQLDEALRQTFPASDPVAGPRLERL